MRVEDRVQRPHHVARRHGNAILPAHPRAQMIRDDRAVGADPAVAAAGDAVEQHGDGAAARVDVDERFEREPRELTFLAVGIGMREERVQRLRVGRDREPDPVGRRKRPRTRRPRAAGTDYCARDRENEPPPREVHREAGSRRTRGAPAIAWR